MADLTAMMQAAAGAGGDANFIEDMFSCFLYTGNDSTQTITNGIDLAGEGGAIWFKSRSNSTNHRIFDTVRGRARAITPDTNAPAGASSAADRDLISFNTSGFSLGIPSHYDINTLNRTYVSWTFRKQPKFFDVVTYTGNGQNNRQIAHNLGSAPGCIITKKTSDQLSWYVYHRSTGNGQQLVLNTTAVAVVTSFWNNTDPTATNFTVSNQSFVNEDGHNYVAYLFAHDAGGFGLSGEDNVISCGSYTGTGAVGPSVNLGYEPQWLLIKRATGESAISGWYLLDNMRGIPLAGGSNYLRADTSDAEINNSFTYATPTATGFNVDPGGTGLTGVNFSGETYIYIAIRRGPMRVPETGTSVFSPVLRTGTGANTTINSGHVTDLIIPRGINNSNSNDFMTTAFLDRLRGSLRFLKTNNTGDAAEASGTNTITSFANMTGVNVGSDSVGFCNIDTIGYVNWLFRRAPSFFDEVCYSGTGSSQTFAHNLGIAPELIFVKTRSNARDWAVYSAPLGATKYLNLNASSVGGTSSTYWNNTTPTSSVFTANTALEVNNLGWTYVAYLFATCPGVSKVGSYIGTGALQTINCGFSSGARFVLIKRTDASGGWYVWDSARGISSGDDPYVVINTNTIQVTSTNFLDTTSVGFQVTAAAPADINASGGTYIFLAIA